MWQRGNENNPAGAATVVLQLSASGGAITGSGYNAFIGVYPLTVSGAASGSAVDMTLIYERGDTVQFHGRLLAGGVLMGDESLDGRGRYPVEYHKVN
jgi:hypothetical protein